MRGSPASEKGGGNSGSTGAAALVARGEGGVDGEGRRVAARRMAASAAVDGDEGGGYGVRQR